MELRRTKLYGTLTSADIGAEEVWRMCHDYISNGKDVNIRDTTTGETFLHVLAGNAEKFVSAAGVSVVYLLATSGVDLDIADKAGDTCLHKAVRVPGTHRLVVALIRCGADVTLKETSGKTAADILRTDKPRDWKETLHWLNVFKTGLRGALTDDPVDIPSVSLLLGGWCRTYRNKGNERLSYQTMCEGKQNGTEVIQLLREHEAKNEFVLALLAGNIMRAQLIKTNNPDVNLNTCDELYTGPYPNNIRVPRPLLAALWEAGTEDGVQVLLSLGADTSLLYSPLDDPCEKEPLFFSLLSKENRPLDTIAHKILINSNMAARNQSGQTILFKAIIHDYSDQFIRALFKYGVNVVARDRKGRSARDFAEGLHKTKYFHVIDEHVLATVKESDVERLTSLILQGYDHVLDLTDNRGFNLTKIMKETSAPSKEVLRLLEKITAIQNHLESMFKAVDTCCLADVKKYISRKFSTAQDRCGRSALHRAILAKSKPIIRFLIDEYPRILNIQDNLGRTVLHYAYLVLEGDSLVRFMIDRGADDTLTDVGGKTPQDYKCETCGQRTYIQLRSDVEGLSMEVFLSETNFEKSLQKAIHKGNLLRVKNLIEGLKERGDINRYTSTLFQCIDSGRQNIAVYLIRNGMRTDIYKQYEKCSPSSSACAMYACDHSVTSFRDRSAQLDCYAVIETMDEVALDEEKGQLQKQQGKLPAMEQFSLLGLL